MKVNVIQFMMPDGRQVPQTTTVSDDCADGYEAMLKAGCRLTAEMLSTGEISVTIEQPEEGDVSIEITRNGPDVQRRLEKMLKKFSKDFEEWKKQNSEEVEP